MKAGEIQAGKNHPRPAATREGNCLIDYAGRRKQTAERSRAQNRQHRSPESSLQQVSLTSRKESPIDFAGHSRTKDPFHRDPPYCRQYLAPSTPGRIHSIGSNTLHQPLNSRRSQVKHVPCYRFVGVTASARAEFLRTGISKLRCQSFDP